MCFRQEGDGSVAEALSKFSVNLIAYQWMNNPWHMVLSPQNDGGMGAFIRWVTLTHTQRRSADILPKVLMAVVQV